ncbi:hypothetical protein [Streptomyces cucumeris]|uniref:hypothetical protein n=1 Tax=Streptomyces cucumeris TaxID=2962890 RepID=UPI003D703A54
MSQLDACEPSVRPTGSPRSDADLIRLIAGGRLLEDTTDTPDDPPSPAPAAEEFRRRHLAAVRSYARICCRDRLTAEELADEVFGQARHTTSLAALSDPAPTARLLENRSLMLRGFRNLPGRTQAVLWHTAVDGETGAPTALLLGVEPERLPSLRKRALRSYRDAYFWAYAAQAAEDDCGRFCGLLDAAARRAGVHHSGDLEGHLARCSQCSRVLNVLVGLGERPAQVLAEGLLPWGGLAHLASRPAPGGQETTEAATGVPSARPATVRRADAPGPGTGTAVAPPLPRPAPTPRGARTVPVPGCPPGGSP